MSFNDRLRSIVFGPDYSNREKMIQDTAQKCIAHFAEKCELWARCGKHSWKELVQYEEGNFEFTILVFSDEDYEAALKEEEKNITLARYVFLKESESETFLSLLRDECRKREMEGFAITKKDWRDVKIRVRYFLYIEMSW